MAIVFSIPCVVWHILMVYYLQCLSTISTKVDLYLLHIYRCRCDVNIVQRWFIIFRIFKIFSNLTKYKKIFAEILLFSNKTFFIRYLFKIYLQTIYDCYVKFYCTKWWRYINLNLTNLNSVITTCKYIMQIFHMVYPLIFVIKRNAFKW